MVGKLGTHAEGDWVMSGGDWKVWDIGGLVEAGGKGVRRESKRVSKQRKWKANWVEVSTVIECGVIIQ